MNLISTSTHRVSKRSLTFNKSFVISIMIHMIIIFGISIATYYKLPIFNESPIINVRLANSSQDYLSNSEFGANEDLMKNLSSKKDGNIQTSKKKFQSFKVKKLQANSKVNSEEAVYLNLWQRKIETIGDKIISNNEKYFNGKVQIMATIDLNGNLVNSEILISSGNTTIDNMAINILKESSPFEPFNSSMSNEYSVLEIVRDWNFSSN